MSNYQYVFYIITDPYLSRNKYERRLPWSIQNWLKARRMRDILNSLGKTMDRPELFEFWHVKWIPEHFIATLMERWPPTRKDYFDFGDLIATELKTPVRIWIYDTDLNDPESLKSIIRKSYHRPGDERIVSGELDTRI